MFTRRHGYAQVVEESVTEYGWEESRGRPFGWRSKSGWRVGVWREERVFACRGWGVAVGLEGRRERGESCVGLVGTTRG